MKKNKCKYCKKEHKGICYTNHVEKADEDEINSKVTTKINNSSLPQQFKEEFVKNSWKFHRYFSNKRGDTISLIHLGEGNESLYGNYLYEIYCTKGNLFYDIERFETIFEAVDKIKFYLTIPVPREGCSNQALSDADRFDERKSNTIPSGKQDKRFKTSEFIYTELTGWGLTQKDNPKSRLWISKEDHEKEVKEIEQISNRISTLIMERDELKKQIFNLKLAITQDLKELKKKVK